MVDLGLKLWIGSKATRWGEDKDTVAIKNMRMMPAMIRRTANLAISTIADLSSRLNVPWLPRLVLPYWSEPGARSGDAPRLRWVLF